MFKNLRNRWNKVKADQAELKHLQGNCGCGGHNAKV
jgi:hypothetical protein